MKETYYFQHDYNATQDPKLIALLARCGLDGIGMFWIMIEILHQQPNSKISRDSYNDYIDFYGRVDGDNEHLLNKIKQVLIDVGLFVEQDGFVYSNRVLENKRQRQEISEKRSFAGKRSTEIRQNQTSVEQVLNKIQHKKGKERKEKEKKLNIIERGETPSSVASRFFNNLEEQERVIEQLTLKGYEPNSVKQEIAKFLSYWTEPNKSGSKQRWEMEQTFEIGRRLATWFSRIKTFNNFTPKDNLSKVKN